MNIWALSGGHVVRLTLSPCYHSRAHVNPRKKKKQKRQIWPMTGPKIIFCGFSMIYMENMKKYIGQVCSPQHFSLISLIFALLTHMHRAEVNTPKQRTDQLCYCCKWLMWSCTFSAIYRKSTRHGGCFYVLFYFIQLPPPVCQYSRLHGPGWSRLVQAGPGWSRLIQAGQAFANTQLRPANREILSHLCLRCSVYFH